MRVNKRQLLLAATPLGNTGSEFTFDRLVNILWYLVENALLLGGFLAVGAIVYYGTRMALARANAAEFSANKDALIKAVIGALMIFGVYTIINTVQGAAGTLTK